MYCTLYDTGYLTARRKTNHHPATFITDTKYRLKYLPNTFNDLIDEMCVQIDISSLLCVHFIASWKECKKKFERKAKGWTRHYWISEHTQRGEKKHCSRVRGRECPSAKGCLYHSTPFSQFLAISQQTAPTCILRLYNRNVSANRKARLPERVLDNNGESCNMVGQLMIRPESRKTWERQFGRPCFRWKDDINISL